MKVDASDFMCNQYFKFYEYCKERFPKTKLIGDKKVGFSAMQIEGDAPFNVSFSGNETKFWFDHFRVFCLEDAKKYADFKLKEIELIKSIEG
jgi:hypothetical protein